MLKCQFVTSLGWLPTIVCVHQVKCGEQGIVFVENAWSEIMKVRTGAPGHTGDGTLHTYDTIRTGPRFASVCLYFE